AANRSRRYASGMGHIVRVPLRGISVLDLAAAPYADPDAPLPTVAAFRAVPVEWPEAATGAQPAVPLLLVHGAWGLDEPVCDLADGLATDGRVVLVPDLAEGRRPADPGAAAALLAGLDAEDGIRILAASVDALRADPHVRGAAASRAGAIDHVDVAGFGGGAPLAAFLAVVRPEIERLVLAGGDPPGLPVAAWDGLEADVLVLLGADQDGGPANAWAATLHGLGRHVAVEVLPSEAVADDPGDAFVEERIRSFLARGAGS
ncbi:MAG: dienelactone hydrolase family protein, partial [Chloroflexi bacterium]|nr:dienelactone hydrolase family protein [Chloroflexota bacterium]